MATVLVVEDEDSLRDTLSRYLAREGHEVIAASSGDEALEAGFDAAPDLLIADWMLKSHIHGLHVSEVFRALNPRLHTILITGFPSRDLLEESDRCGVSHLLEKPFELWELQDAVDRALAAGRTPDPAGAAPIAAIAVGVGGELDFVSPRAAEHLARLGLPAHATRFDELVEGDVLSVLEQAESTWGELETRGPRRTTWLLRARRRAGRVGWLAVVCPREQRRSDPRVRILLDVRAATPHRSLGRHGPVIVLERDGVVRRLLVSQIERVGAICYASDDLPSALRLLAAEPRARTVLVDFALAGDAMSDWVGPRAWPGSCASRGASRTCSRRSAARPDPRPIGRRGSEATPVQARSCGVSRGCGAGPLA